MRRQDQWEVRTFISICKGTFIHIYGQAHVPVQDFLDCGDGGGGENLNGVGADLLLLLPAKEVVGR